MTHCCLVSLQIGTQYNKGGEHQSTILKGDTQESAGHHDQRRSPRGEAQVFSLYDWTSSIHRLASKYTFRSCSFVNEAAIKAANLPS